MAETDVLPIDPDYPVGRSRLEGRATFVSESGERIVRAVAPYARVFDLSFGALSYADWVTLNEFMLAHHSDYFTFVDKSDANRDYTVLHEGWPAESEIGYESVNNQVRLVEQPGKPLRNYPTAPLLTLPVAQFFTVAGVGKVAEEVGDRLLLLSPKGHGHLNPGTTRITNSGDQPQFSTPQKLYSQDPHNFIDPLKACGAVVSRLVSLDLLRFDAELVGQAFLAKAGRDACLYQSLR
ncbi:MAG: hypothetical protein O2968_03995 [Acidobacteria bacterium]|nr:hypothetical protein [Acidobacteriota bacterium]